MSFLQVETIEDETTKIEEFIDLLTSFYSEIIDYALHFIHSFVQIKWGINYSSNYFVKLNYSLVTFYFNKSTFWIKW